MTYRANSWHDTLVAMLGCPLDRRLRGRDGACRQDHGQVAEGLRKVAYLATAADVVLLGEQAQIVGQADEPLEQGPCLPDAAVQGQCADQPEGADQELTLVPRQPIVG